MATSIIPARAIIPFLVAMMLFTGVCNTLLTKYQDNQCVRDCDNPDPAKRHHFEQPVIQTLQMFVGEVGCWLVVGLLSLYHRYTGRSTTTGTTGAAAYQPLPTTATAADEADAASIHSTTALNPAAAAAKPHAGAPPVLGGWRVTLLALPAICDILGTTLMNAGLLLVAASIYQMTRGALVLFVGLFSVVFLRRHLHLFQWLSLLGVVLGVAIVGLAGAIQPDKKHADAVAGDGGVDGGAAAGVGADALRVIVGVFMIAGAQVFTATQFVLEEWILERSAIEPIRVVGWEGLFGFIVTLLGMLVLHAAIGRTEAGRGGPFDMVEGWRQFWEYRAVFVSSILIMISIGGFNFFGLSVTRSVSATSRSTIDTCRTLFIWIVSLGLGWETFKWLQVLGFALLVYSTFLFNGVVQPPFAFLRVPEVEELLPEEPIEHN
ncbi:6487edd8-0ce3-477f-b830-a7bc5134543d [Thermothielavioides terrestris]|uniref:6487edd8-0ce3-477f-b830-a7bc5134543d n=1 Tax=Thermothielavioides terrestris TaxID=2587410 RepID=A0A3S4AP42_9PEZI|nr:6487edd8-0ce3-477f-b830-a7bc5134543d [Thermothielavioides terrestris]